MATIKPHVNTAYKRSDGTYAVSLLFTHGRKKKYISTPFYVTQSQITKSGKIKDAVLNDAIGKEILKVRYKIAELGFAINDMDIEELISAVYAKKSEDVDFIEFCRNKIKKIANDKDRKITCACYNNIVNSFVKFVGKDKVYFSEMTRQVVQNWYNGVLENAKASTANNYLAIMRSLYNRARRELNDEDAGTIIVKYNCFDNIDKNESEIIEPRSFDTIDQMQKIIDCPYRNLFRYNFVKDMFVFSFICFGINPRDFLFLRKEDYKDGVITYRRHKIARRAGKNAEQKIKVPDVGRIIIEKYSGDKNGYLFNLYGCKRETYIFRDIQKVFIDAGVCERVAEKNGNKRISHDYVFYTARYSMSTFAKNICGIDWITVNDMLNHTIPSELKMTEGYVKGKDYKSIWDANEKLYNLFDWSFYLNQAKK